MKMTRAAAIACMLAVCILAFAGCGSKADENKPVAEVRAEAEKMNVEQLKSMAMEYKNAIMAKSKEVEAFTAKLQKIPVTDMMGKEAQAIKTDIDNINKSLTALKERFQVYYDKLKEKGGDVAGLQL